MIDRLIDFSLCFDAILQKIMLGRVKGSLLVWKGLKKRVKCIIIIIILINSKLWACLRSVTACWWGICGTKLAPSLLMCGYERQEETPSWQSRAGEWHLNGRPAPLWSFPGCDRQVREGAGTSADSAATRFKRTESQNRSRYACVAELTRRNSRRKATRHHHQTGRGICFSPRRRLIWNGVTNSYFGFSWRGGGHGADLRPGKEGEFFPLTLSGSGEEILSLNECGGLFKWSWISKGGPVWYLNECGKLSNWSWIRGSCSV